ncbi:hypothetical protein PYCC9005_005797 [Savitreella phatthalungensis]
MSKTCVDMAVNSLYNTRRKRVKLSDDVYTPPASPAEEREDAVMLGVIDYLARTKTAAGICSRQISEGMVAEGKLLGSPTPSTLVDAAIKSHIKRQGPKCIVDKIADSRFPRKTLYRLKTATAEAKSTSCAVQDDEEIDSQDNCGENDPDDYEFGHDNHNTAGRLSNYGQGPFAGPLGLRERVMSPSPELDDTLPVPHAHTPAASNPGSPALELKDFKQSKRELVNIALPPSPFISPRESVEEQEEEVPRRQVRFIDSPELVTLGELESLLDA